MQMCHSSRSEICTHQLGNISFSSPLLFTQVADREERRKGVRLIIVPNFRYLFLRGKNTRRPRGDELGE